MGYQNIKHIADYEIKNITREWGFRFVVTFLTSLITWIHLNTQSNLFHPEWIAISLPSTIPYVNTYLTVYFQLILAIFWGGNWIIHNKTDESAQALSIRPFSNIELLWGKILGFLKIQLILSLSWNLIALVIHLLLSDAPFSLVPYIFYYLTLSLPALIFAVGLAIFVKGFIKNRFISLFVLLAFYAIILWRGNVYSGLFSLPADTLPNMFSDITGFPNLFPYLQQRLMLCFMGIGLLLLTSSQIERIPNSIFSPRRTGWIGISTISLGIACAVWFVLLSIQEQQSRETLRQTFARYENHPKVDVTYHEISFKQNGHSYTAQSNMILYNRHPQGVKEIILYLNPGLIVTSVMQDDSPLKFTRDKQVLLISKPLAPNDSIQLVIDYEGNINPNICYSEITDLDAVSHYRKHYIFQQGKDYFYLQPELTLLTPECIWYPTGIPPVNVLSPQLSLTDYCQFRLSVIGEKERVILSQGESTIQGDTVLFDNKHPLSGITLCMGPYTRKVLSLGNIRYELYLLRGHDSIVKKINNPQALAEIWQRSNPEYPYNKLALVEAPLHFCSYARPWKSRSEFVQPEIFFRPEREATTFTLDADAYAINPHFPPMLEWYTYFMRATLSEERDIYTGNFFANLLPKYYPKKKSVQNEYYPKSQEIPYQVQFFSPEFPGIHLLFEKMRTWIFSDRALQNYGYGKTYLSAIEAFRHQDLTELINHPDVMDFFHLKGQILASQLQCLTSLEKIKTFLQEFLKSHNFQNIRYEDFCQDFHQKHHIDLLALTRQAYQTNSLPLFVFKDPQTFEIEEKNGEKSYLQKIKVWNKGKEDGILTFCDGYTHDTNYLIRSGECVEIKRIGQNTYEPESWEIHTLLSQNIPSVLKFNTPPIPISLHHPETGIFLIDSNEFLSSADEYVVDNSDTGFQLYNFDGLLLEKNKIINTKGMQTSEKTTSKWACFYSHNAYGCPEQSYASKECGSGKALAEWRVELKESGIYEIFVFNNRVSPEENEKRWIEGKKNPMFGQQRTPVQYYTIIHEDTEDSVELETNNAAAGWTSLGKYTLPAGVAKVVLSDKGAYPYQVIYADAVKWVKK